jgi:diguanylate cyclase (GGDEF)-like protein
VLSVSVSTRETEAAWRAKAIGIGIVVLVLCGLTVALALLFGRELRHRERMHAEMARLSETDALTGLGNRRRFEQALALASEEALRTAKPLSMLVMDADHFKRFNDRYGHAVGDQVLQGLARCLTASVHRPGDLACRIGGEEFTLLLSGTDEPGALSVAEEVHAQVSRLAVGSAGAGTGAVTVSIGLATGIIDGPGLFARADAALYEAKAAGRNRTRCAAPSKIEHAAGQGLRSVGS